MKFCIFWCSVAYFSILILFQFVNSEDEEQPWEEENILEEIENGEYTKYMTTKCKCGRSNNITKIVGGTESKKNAWPWMAAIVNIEGGDNNWRIHCGSSIICSKYVLTAAHCFPPPSPDSTKNDTRATNFDNFRVIVGDNTINGGNSPSRQVLKIKSIKTHPKYNSTTYNYDAAIVKLETNLTFSDNVLPICLGQAGYLFVNRTATVAGWGTTPLGDYGVNKLRDVDVKITTNAICSEAYKDTESEGVTVNQICATLPNKDACQGDSGSPLFVDSENVPNVYKQVGIVSFGQDCASKTYPGVYTRVQKIISWIVALTKDGSYCTDSFSPNYNRRRVRKLGNDLDNNLKTN